MRAGVYVIYFLLFTSKQNQINVIFSSCLSYNFASVRFPIEQKLPQPFYPRLNSKVEVLHEYPTQYYSTGSISLSKELSHFFTIISSKYRRDVLSTWFLNPLFCIVSLAFFKVEVNMNTLYMNSPNEKILILRLRIFIFF